MTDVTDGRNPTKSFGINLEVPSLTKEDPFELILGHQMLPKLYEISTIKCQIRDHAAKVSWAVLLGTWCLLLASTSYAWPGRSGQEWTFTNGNLIELGRQREINRSSAGAYEHDRLQRDLIENWHSEISRRCSWCTIRSADRELYVVYAADRWIKISGDPWVIEVTGAPSTTQDLRSDADILQALIFDSAKQIGLSPHSRIGGGHIHFEISTYFDGDKLLFRNFIVDLANHPELFLGILGMDALNAPPIALLSESQRQAFADVIREFDEGRMDIHQLMREIRRRVYTSTFYAKYPHQQAYPDKYQAVNLNHEDTIELRGLNPEISVDQHLKILRLFEKRIEFLKQLKQPLAYQNKDYSHLIEVHSERSLETYVNHLDPATLENTFKAFVTETGLDWSEHRKVFMPDLMKPRGKNACGVW